jgi:two-component system LytT family sensor kinase
MEVGCMEGRLGRKLHGIWMSCSLERKVRWITISTAAVVILSITAVMLIAGYGMKGFGDLLMGNSRSLAFWSAMDAESSSFQYYAGDRSPENREKYELSCARTRSALKSLPFDYDVIGPERYARTWNIKNGYEGYQTFRDQVLHMDQSDEGFVEQLYRVYGMQGYLQTYARRLMQSTLKEGKRSYQEKVPLLYDLPYMIMACSVLMIITVICLTKLLSNTLIAPMVKLAHSSREIARNDFGGEDLVVENRDEMGELVQAFNKMKHATEGYINTLKEKNEMAERLHKEEVERIEMEKRLDAARLELLKSQINPHFLFNTLNMISCMAKLEEAQTTERMISSLGNLFRYNLKTSEQIVPLERELKVVQDYMYIQQMRFGSRISHDLRVEVDGGETMIPAFTLQPLVENAIIHGIARKEEGGRIFLRIWKRKDKIVISLADTGVGMEEEALKRLMDALKGHRTARVGIGLGNIYQRIKSMYEDGDLRIYSKAGKGTVVQIILPAAREEDYQKI